MSPLGRLVTTPCGATLSGNGWPRPCALPGQAGRFHLRAITDHAAAVDDLTRRLTFESAFAAAGVSGPGHPEPGKTAWAPGMHVPGPAPGESRR